MNSDDLPLFDFQRDDVAKLSPVNGLDALILSPTTIRNFCKRVLFGDPFECWLWTGALGGELNYGTFAWRVGKQRFQTPAHKFSYELCHGRVPKGYHVDHVCLNKLCVNPFPKHLEAVTPQINAQRRSALVTHCPQNHPLSGENLYIDPRGYRECKTCRYNAVKRFRGEGVVI